MTPDENPAPRLPLASQVQFLMEASAWFAARAAESSEDREIHALLSNAENCRQIAAHLGEEEKRAIEAAIGIAVEVRDEYQTAMQNNRSWVEAMAARGDARMMSDASTEAERNHYGFTSAERIRKRLEQQLSLACAPTNPARAA